MNEEEINKVMEELRAVSPEKLNEEAKRVFKAIMKIADERDELREKISEYEKQLDLDYAEEKIDELYNALDNANWEKSQKDKIIKKKEKQLDKYKMLLAENTATRVVTSIKDNKKSNEDLEMLNEGWKIKLKEIIDECIPKKENIITKELEYTPNANANSYLTQRILELLEESEK